MYKKIIYKLEQLSTRQLVYLFIIIFIIKLALFFIIDYLNIISYFDAQQYHLHAIGLAPKERFTFWSHILAWLHEYGLYSYKGVKYTMFFLSSFVSPLLLIGILRVGNAKEQMSSARDNIYWLAAILFSLYLSPFLFSLDILRDDIMLFLFLCTVLFVKYFSITKGPLAFLYYFFAFIIGAELYYWRNYLGFSIVFALISFNLLSLKQLNFWIVTALYVGFLLFAYRVGYLDIFFHYRAYFKSGGSTLHISFFNVSPIRFISLYSYSVLTQLLGFYFPNLRAVVLFLLESVPFMLGIFYIFKNRSRLQAFEKFLLLFSLVYATVWLLANDNLGTAVRLRMFNYVSVLIVVFSLYLRQKYAQKGVDA